MAEFFSFLKVFVMCGTMFFITTVVLMAMPQCKLRSIDIEMSKWVLALALIFMVPSPVDALPDVVPGVGWLDDIGYVIGACCAAKAAMEERKRRTVLEQLEFDQAVASRRAAGSSSGADVDKTEVA